MADANRDMWRARSSLHSEPLVSMRPSTLKLYMVVVPGCAPGHKMRLHLSTEFSGTLDEYGVCLDALWRMRTPGLPDRWLRLWNGHKSLFALLKRYSFFDSLGCAYSAEPAQAMRRNAAECARATGSHPPDLADLHPRVAYAMRCRRSTRFAHAVPCHVPVHNVGVAQLSAQSGICWWGALWYALSFNGECRAVVDRAVAQLPGGPVAAVLRETLPLVLNDGAASERLRSALFEHCGIGDRPGQSPELDGQNAYVQLTRLCEHLRIPLTTLHAPTGHLGDGAVQGGGVTVDGTLGVANGEARGSQGALHGPGLLGVRAHRKSHVPPFALSHGGHSWRLRSALVGSEFCGHQVALASHGRDQRKWALYDADAVRDCIGPIAWDTGEGTGQSDWWTALEWILPLINSTDTSLFCDMNPRNRHPMEPIASAFGAAGGRAAESVLRGLGGPGHRTVNIDWIYTAET
jgi:hypothetical protein